MKGHSEKTFVSFCSCAIMSAYCFFITANMFSPTLSIYNETCLQPLSLIYIKYVIVPCSLEWWLQNPTESFPVVQCLLSSLAYRTWTCSTGTPIDGAVGSRRNGRGGGGGGEEGVGGDFLSTWSWDRSVEKPLFLNLRGNSLAALYPLMSLRS